MEELLSKAILGDKDAFTDIILEYEQELYKIARMRLNNDYDICEAVQSTMILAYKHIKKVKNTNYLKTWIVRILINECKKIYKKNKKQILEDTQMEEVIDTKNDYDLVNSELNFNLLLRTLDYEERQILILYYSSVFSIKEVSNILHINENTVKTKMRKAKSKLKEKFRGEMFYE